MNKFKKYCPNVWVAECEEEYKKGDVITLETKYGKEVECEVYNFLCYTGTKENHNFCYSIVRLDESYAQKKAEKYANASLKSQAKSQSYYEASQEGKDFLSMGEPIKVGHHSEKAHRALIERNCNRMGKSVELDEKAKEQARKAEYWEMKADEITLANPESIHFYNAKLEKAIELHKFYKENPSKREHSYSLTYANKDVKELKKKVEIAEKLWGVKE